MNGPDSISDPVARRLRYTKSYPSARGLARLGSAWLQHSSAQLSSARRGSARVWWRGRWVPLCWLVRWLDADMACQLCMLASCLHHDDVILIRVWHMGRVGSTHPGEEDACDAWRASVRVASHPAGAWRRVRPFPTSDFDVIFTSGFVSSSSTQWYGQNTILTTLIFEQKSNITLNHVLWYQLLGDSGSPLVGLVVFW